MKSTEACSHVIYIHVEERYTENCIATKWLSTFLNYVTLKPLVFLVGHVIA